MYYKCGFCWCECFVQYSKINRIINDGVQLNTVACWWCCGEHTIRKIAFALTSNKKLYTYRYVYYDSRKKILRESSSSRVLQETLVIVAMETELKLRTHTVRFCDYYYYYYMNARASDTATVTTRGYQADTTKYTAERAIVVIHRRCVVWWWRWLLQITFIMSLEKIQIQTNEHIIHIFIYVLYEIYK